LVLMLAAAVLFLQTAPSFGRATRADVVKARVGKLGLGKHVKVKIIGGEELHGNITAIGGQSFRLRPDNATAETEIAYSQVVLVKENPGKITWIVIAVVAVVVVVGVIVLVARSQLNGKY